MVHKIIQLHVKKAIWGIFRKLDSYFDPFRCVWTFGHGRGFPYTKILHEVKSSFEKLIPLIKVLRLKTTMCADVNFSFKHSEDSGVHLEAQWHFIKKNNKNCGPA